MEITNFHVKNVGEWNEKEESVNLLNLELEVPKVEAGRLQKKPKNIDVNYIHTVSQLKTTQVSTILKSHRSA